MIAGPGSRMGNEAGDDDDDDVDDGDDNDQRR